MVLKLLLTSDSRMLMMGRIVPVEGRKVGGPWAHSIKQTLMQIKLSSSISVCGENSRVVFSCFAYTLFFTVRYWVTTGHGAQAMAGDGSGHEAEGKLFLMGDWRWALCPSALCCHLCNFMTTAEAESEEWKFILKNVLTL